MSQSILIEAQTSSNRLRYLQTEKAINLHHTQRNTTFAVLPQKNSFLSYNNPEISTNEKGEVQIGLARQDSIFND